MKSGIILTIFVLLTSISYTQTVTDIDGNLYHTVTIGTQIWFKENLKTTKLQDGTTIPMVSDESAWYKLSTIGYCWYNNDSSAYENLYGKLYNFYCVQTDQLCPDGWHVPSDYEWTILTEFLGGNDIAGGKLKEADTIHWQSPNTGASNESGFTALPGGDRVANGTFGGNAGYNGSWWTSSEFNPDAWGRILSQFSESVYRDDFKLRYGFSVRCMKENNLSTIIPRQFNNSCFYPNPTKSKLYFTDFNIVGKSATFYDLQGKIIYSGIIEENPIDISDLTNGIYIIRVMESRKVIVDKFIKY